MLIQMPSQLPDSLPPLREDLRLNESAPYTDGSPSWTIQDPVSNTFYRIGWLEFEMLARWHLGAPRKVLAATAAETLLDPHEDELLVLIEFLQQNHLLVLRGPRFTEKLVETYRKNRLSRAQWLLHHYLFFRIPLWHPELWLRRALPWVQWIYRPGTAYAVVALCLIGLLLTARQIDAFSASFADTLSPGGFLAYMLALAFAKSLHELGHAFTATRQGVRVAHMGVAFLVLWPILYTDTSESWRLKDRRQRLAIASAGIVSELALAGLATLAWNVAPPGDFRQALFFLATTAWLVSLGLNASPFMRFDGYFILSDILDIPNLHERTFALARTWLRNVLFNWHDPDPEPFGKRRPFLIAFAIGTWLYRLVVFTGIAVAVYMLFFKLLGIFLFIVEIAWFIVRPVYNEISIWKERRDEIPPNRRRTAGLIAGGVIVLGLIPWNLTVTASAWAHGENAHTIYSPHAGRIREIPAQAGPVEQHAVLFVLDQPESRLRANVATAAATALERQLAGLSALPEGEARRLVIARQHAMKQAEASAEVEEAERMLLRAPITGHLTDIEPLIAPGVWVESRDPLAIVVDPANWVVEAYVRQEDLNHLSIGHTARFYPENARLFPLKGRIIAIEPSRVTTLSHPMLSSRFGGSLPVLSEQSGLQPRDVLYRIRIEIDSPPSYLQVCRGTVLIEAGPRSWLIDAMKAILAVAIRETTF